MTCDTYLNEFVKNFQNPLNEPNFPYIFALPKGKITLCESSSAGRARPCQGRGREFESRLSLSFQARSTTVPLFSHPPGWWNW